VAIQDYRKKDEKPEPKEHTFTYKKLGKQYNFQQFTDCDGDCDTCNIFKRCLMNVLFEIRMGVWTAAKRWRRRDEGWE